MNFRKYVLLPVGVLLLSGCQSYNFNPVGHCIIQPGSTVQTLANVSSADILFVVDDSSSMDSKQQGLAGSFDDFIRQMVTINTDRVAKHLQPIDFHLAVTTSSIFSAPPRGSEWCVQAPSGSGLACCNVSACTDAPGCTPGAACGSSGQRCVDTKVFSSAVDAAGTTYQYVSGDKLQCCSVPASCDSAGGGCYPGDACPAFDIPFASQYTQIPGCALGVATLGAPYPAGSFVGLGQNPRVVHFDRTLDFASWGTANVDPQLQQRVNWFKQNVLVGSCGSGQEQHLEAARLAIQKAIAGQQTDLAPDGSTVKADWPHPGAKLIVVFVGDEDDCSSPRNAPLVMLGSSEAGRDSCTYDKSLPAARQREIPVTDYENFFSGLVRPGGPADLGAAFIVSGVTCADGSFAAADAQFLAPPASCTPAAPACSVAFAGGVRLLDLAGWFQSKGHDLVEASVCESVPPKTFGPTLAGIADLVKVPSVLTLDTLPASSDITVVRITGASGTPGRTCTQGTDWWFVQNPKSTTAVPGPTQYLFLNHQTGNCEANPGESYSAEYLGVVPAGGCASTADCSAALGGGSADWSCFIQPGQSRGTCLCGAGNTTGAGP